MKLSGKESVLPWEKAHWTWLVEPWLLGAGDVGAGSPLASDSSGGRREPGRGGG